MFGLLLVVCELGFWWCDPCFEGAGKRDPARGRTIFLYIYIKMTNDKFIDTNPWCIYFLPVQCSRIFSIFHSPTGEWEVRCYSPRQFYHSPRKKSWIMCYCKRFTHLLVPLLAYFLYMYIPPIAISSNTCIYGSNCCSQCVNFYFYVL